jgi:hypothetical protein
MGKPYCSKNHQKILANHLFYWENP